MRSMDDDNPPVPITYEGNVLHYLHYGNYRLIRNLQLLPFVEVGLVVLFLGIAYFGFRNLKRAEQRYIWVGMAKETAHQLGTPLSSLLGWLEIFRGRSREGKIKMEVDTGASFDQVLDRMFTDTRRLQQVANRFGLIGSEPHREESDLQELILSTAEYFEARLPFKGKGATLHARVEKSVPAVINAELIGWVLENLIKNALESVDSRTGRIDISLDHDEDEKLAIIRVVDNGRGIPTNLHKKIFTPGHTSKKRGWGLGLTLSRRIVAEYHNGRIYVAESIPNVRTEFVIELPTAV
jgi:signal transduction histidine kinase